MAGCTDNHIWLSEQRCGRLWVYDSVHIPDLVFLLSVFQMSQKPLWQVSIRDDCLNSHVPDFLFTWFRNRSCHPFFLCGCRFFPCGIMVCYRMGRAISITTMNYSVAIFVYSRMIRYPAISQNCDIAGYQNKDSREWREHAPFWIQISQNLHLQKCININPLMEIIKKKYKSHATTCHSPFVEVAIC